MKLKLLLFPLVPLSALGLVEVVDTFRHSDGKTACVMTEPAKVAQPQVAPRIAQPAPALTPGPIPTVSL